MQGDFIEKINFFYKFLHFFKKFFVFLPYLFAKSNILTIEVALLPLYSLTLFPTMLSAAIRACLLAGPARGIVVILFVLELSIVTASPTA